MFVCFLSSDFADDTIKLQSLSLSHACFQQLFVPTLEVRLRYSLLLLF